MAPAPAASSVNHRRRAKVAACGTCGNDLCADCIVHTPVGVKCRNCTGVKGTGASAGTHVTAGAGSVRADAAAGARRRPWAVPLAAVGLVVLAVAGFGLFNGGSDPVDDAVIDAGLAPEFTERHSAFAGASGQSLGGTLTLPGAGDGQNVPAVLIVPGTGAIDRNGAVAATGADALRDALVSTVTGIGAGSGDPLYKDLSETLAKAGIATFRYEKRGTTPSPLDEGRKLSFDDEVGDARAALDVLADRAEVGSAPIALIGHDTGGVIAMRLAGRNPRIKAVVAVSTPGRPLADVLAADLARVRDAATADQFRAAVATLTATGRAPAPETVPELLRPVFASGHDDYLRTLFTLDPATDAAGVSAPVLLVRGGADRSVTAADSDRLAAALQSPSEVMVASAQADHNLSLAGAVGHEHSNSVTGPVNHRDNDASAALTTWLKARLAG
jgi:alpha-beta hydrolase superfamily lysophospholipase